MRRFSVLIACSLPLFSYACYAPGGTESGGSSSGNDDDDDDDDDDDGNEETSRGDSAEGTNNTSSNTSTTGLSTSTTATTASSVTSAVTSSTTATSNVSAGDTSTTGVNDNGGDECTDIPPDERYPCSTWLEWGECESEWLAGFCEATCGKCVGGTSDPSTTSSDSSPDTNTTSNSTTGDLGDDNPFSPINGGSMGWATRYWDCCKPSCGWSGNSSNPVSSCDMGDSNQGANDVGSACSGGGSFTCHRMSPWAYSNVVSFGFAAVNGVGCGTCFQLEFTGASHNAGNDPGSQALAGKTMVVMATNIGNITEGQFDILTPGGGVGEFNACSTQWGVTNDELGAQYGGFLLQCKQQNGNDYAASRECVRQKCESVFGSRGLDELYDGCMWFVDWFAAADNPSFRYQQIDCPAELTAAAH